MHSDKATEKDKQKPDTFEGKKFCLDSAKNMAAINSSCCV